MTPRSFLFFLWIALFPVFANVLPGCASLRVDIDVYKGPLANEKEVQLEQMASMTIGAKPLLLTLRDTMEANARGTAVERFKQAPGYSPKYIEEDNNPATEGVDLWFESDHARRVNGILFLYEDLKDSPGCGIAMLEPLSLNIKRLLLLYTAAAEEAAAEPRNAKKASDCDDILEELYFEVLRGFVLLNEKDKLHGDGSGYRICLREETRNTLNSLAIRFIEQVLRVGSIQQWHAARAADPMELDSEPSELETELQATFGPQYQRMDYLDSEYWVVQRPVLNDISVNINHERNRSRYVGIKEAIVDLLNTDEYKFGKALLEDSEKFKGLAAFPPKVYACCTSDCCLDEGNQRKVCVSEACLTQGCCGEGKKCERKAIRKLSAAPDHIRVTLPSPVTPERVAKLTGMESLKLDSFLQYAWDAVKTMQGNSGLEGGRLQLGIESRIKEYLEAADNTQGDDDNPDRKKKQEALEDILIQFAEKVLMLANNEILFQDSPAYSGNAASKSTIRRYTHILQAVGNSILNQANELIARRRHEEGQSAKRDAEILALKTGISATEVAPGVFLAQIRDDISSALDKAAALKTDLEKQQKDVLDSSAALADSLSTLGTAKQSAETASKAASEAADIAAKDLKSAEDALKTAQKELLAAPDDAAKKAVVDTGEQNVAKGKKEKETKDAEKTAAETALAKATNEWERKKEEVDAASARAKSLSEEITAAAAKVNEFGLALQGFDSASGKARSAASPADAHQLLILELQNQESAAVGDKKDKFSLALRQIEGIRPPLGSELGNVPNAQTAKDVLDQMIAALREEHINIVRIFGKDSEAAQNLEQAIKAAHDHRSGMVYIRPPSFFLRDSYPVTALQDDPTLSWQNRLRRNAYKAFPLLDEFLVNKGQREAIMTQSEIDKQFWQNINTVRVNGTGGQNYVIAQDDIGNWYVKGYSSNPERIIESAKNLGLFALGGSIEANLLDLQDRRNGKQGAGQLYSADVAKRNSSQAYNNRIDAYLSQTVSDRDILLADLDAKGGLKSRIESGWASITGTAAGEPYLMDLKKQLDGAYKAFLAPARDALGRESATETASDSISEALSQRLGPAAKEALHRALQAAKEEGADPNLGIRIVNALNAVVRFHTDLSARVGAIAPGDKFAKAYREKVNKDATDEQISKAADELKTAITSYMRSILSGEIQGMIEHRQSVVDNFIASMETFGNDIGFVSRPKG